MKLLVQSFVALLLIVNGYCTSQKEIEHRKCYGTICWNPENYPAEEVMSRLYKADSKNMHTFGEFETQIEAMRLETASCSMCKHMTSLKISPLTVQDGGEIFYVVRTRKYHHTITLNICESEEVQQKESSCLNTNDSQEILDMKKACEQKYSNIKFLVYDKKNEKFIEKTLQYPSACVCTIEKTMLK